MRYLRSVLRHVGDILVVTDETGRIVEWNEAATRVTGYSLEEALGTRPEEYYVDPRIRRKIADRLDASPDGRLDGIQVRIRHRDGRRIWIQLTLSRLYDDAGKSVGTVGCSRDITEERRLQRELKRLSITDSLTGLYNQHHFFRELEREKERAVRLGHPLTLLLFDLDRFKELNDSQGHLEGDRVLRAVGGVIFESIRKEVDQGFRYGGDEFTVLLPGTDPHNALKFADRIRRRIERRHLGITASMGLCPFVPENRSLQLVDKADHAMYLSKRAGGNRISAYDPGTDSFRDVTKELVGGGKKRPAG